MVPRKCTDLVVDGARIDFCEVWQAFRNAVQVLLLCRKADKPIICIGQRIEGGERLYYIR